MNTDATTKNNAKNTLDLPRTPLGKTGVLVSRVGLGCMGMSGVYGAANDDEAIRTIHHYLDAGGNFLDTADVYGMGHNEELVGRAIAGRRTEVFLATKFGLSGISNSPSGLTVNGRPDYVKSACDKSLQRLGVEQIDLYFLHRKDPNVAIEETVGAMGELVQAGKVRFIGLSEVSSDTLKKAHKIHPIAALQSEYSAWVMEAEKNIFPACREIGAAFIAYSPLGRGALSGALKDQGEFSAKDWRAVGPRFQGKNWKKNQELIASFFALASAKKVTPAQLAIAFILAQGDDIFPIPGTKSVARLDENLGAARVALSSAEQAAIRAWITAHPPAGDRYPEVAYRYVEK